MPANKSKQNREEKRAELISAARRLFIEDGYEATSMNAVAGAAGVSGNTTYWYFDSKDDLLVAVLDAVLADALTHYEDVIALPLEQQLLWVVGTLRELRRLVATVHSRVAQSPTVDTWHTGFHEMAEELFRATLERSGLDSATVDAEVKIGVFTIEALLTHEVSEAEQQSICRRLAAHWT